MPSRSKKTLEARYKAAEEQLWGLLSLVSVYVSDEDLKEAERFASMTGAELKAYYTSPEGLAEIAEALEFQREAERLEAIPTWKRPNPLGRKLLRHGLLEFYQKIQTRVIKGVPRKQIAKDLGVSTHGVKMGLRALRLLIHQDRASHKQNGIHKDFSQYLQCPQCRGYLNQGTKAYSDTDPRRRKKIKELPVTEEEMDWWVCTHGDGNRRLGREPIDY